MSAREELTGALLSGLRVAYPGVIWTVEEAEPCGTLQNVDQGGEIVVSMPEVRACAEDSLGGLSGTKGDTR